METKTLIYITNEEYIQKTFKLEKTSIRTNDVYFNQRRAKGFKKISQKSEIKSEIKKLVSKNDIILASKNIENQHTNITTGGVIYGDKIPVSIMNKAITKENNRIMKINNYFEKDAYIESYIETKTNEDNKKLIVWLLELEKSLLTGKVLEKEAVYSKLLNALIETPQPIRTDNYNENLKQLKLEYSKS